MLILCVVYNCVLQDLDPMHGYMMSVYILISGVNVYISFIATCNKFTTFTFKLLKGTILKLTDICLTIAGM